MDYRDWEILKVLYNQKNLTKAARLLFITQPALTNRLKHMQEELGAKIGKRQIAPTFMRMGARSII